VIKKTNSKNLFNEQITSVPTFAVKLNVTP